MLQFGGKGCLREAACFDLREEFKMKIVGILATVVALLGTGLKTANAEESDMLTIGSVAPSIDVEHWVSNGDGKFSEVTKFESGKVYVVEFWATWCGPCIMSMPHLAEMQTSYADAGVQFISVSDEDLDTVESFLKRTVRGEEEKTYGELTKVYCLTTDPDRSVHDDYMEAAYQMGIPTAFIVGKEGLVEWIGHPMSMDEPLAAVVDGSWDRTTIAEEILAEQKSFMVMEKVQIAMQEGDTEKAMGLINSALESLSPDSQAYMMLSNMKGGVVLSPAMELMQSGETKKAMAKLDELRNEVDEDLKGQIDSMLLNLAFDEKMYDRVESLLNAKAKSEDSNASELNMVAWQVWEMVDEKDSQIPEAVVSSALAVAEKAVAMEPENGMILDTLAHFLYKKGDLDRALEVQRNALKNAMGMDADLKEFLELLEAEKAKK